MSEEWWGGVATEEDEEIELVGYADHEGHVWREAESAHNYFTKTAKCAYSLRPTYAVKCAEKHFDKKGNEA